MTAADQPLRALLRQSKPLALLGGAVLYALGASILRYLGRPVDAALYLQGQGLVTALQLAAHFLLACFAPPKPSPPQEDPSHNGREAEPDRPLPASTPAFRAAVTCLAFAGTVASLLLMQGRLPLTATIVLAMGTLVAVFYGAPPLRLVSSGYGEVLAAVIMAGLVPTFAFALQTEDLHRLLLMATAPLVALYFALAIALELPSYATDLKHGERTLMVRIGWERAMRLHDAALALAALFVLLAYLNGFPRRVAYGALIAAPLALAQAWQMGRIRQGYPPRWQLLRYGAVTLFGLTLYLELVGFFLS